MKAPLLLQIFLLATRLLNQGLGILWLNAKTRTDKDFQGRGWQFITKQDTTDDLELFNCTHKLWLAQNKDLVPRQQIYSLKIKTNAR